MTAAKKLNLVQENAQVILDGKNVELPVIVGSENEKAFDITKLRALTGYITLDSGYMNTGACESGVTFLDGENGILRYRGYPIEQLAEKSSFIEVSYLLFFGKLPTASDLTQFEEQIKKASELPSRLKNILKFAGPGTHPMAMLAGGLNFLSGFHPEFSNPNLNPEQKKNVFIQMMGEMKALCAYIYRATGEKNFPESNSKYNYCEDFLNMMFYHKGYRLDPEVAKALDILLILHADHEQNCSTSTVRLVGSSQANIYGSIAAGVNALWGPLHGGANQAVIEMLEEIQKGGGDYKKFLQRAKDKNDTFRLMGFGHRVYKNFDPRAKIIKKACDIVLKKLGVKDPLLEIAKGLEEEALKDQYFVDRKLYPNVDFYSGIIYKAMGIPSEMFTVMFALGRLPGWLSQWREMIESPSAKIGRPRQIYTGEVERDYIDVGRRKKE